jgi:hypothetical protein
MIGSKNQKKKYVWFALKMCDVFHDNNSVLQYKNPYVENNFPLTFP